MALRGAGRPVASAARVLEYQHRGRAGRRASGHRHLLDGLLGHRLAADDHPIAPCPLGPIERLVGGLEQRLVVDGLSARGADADRERDPHTRGLHLADGQSQPLGDLTPDVAADRRKHDEELLAAGPVDELEGVQPLAQLIGDVAQRGIAAAAPTVRVTRCRLSPLSYA